MDMQLKSGKELAARLNLPPRALLDDLGQVLAGIVDTNPGLSVPALQIVLAG